MEQLTRREEQKRYDDAIQCLGETARELTEAKRRIKVLEKEQVALMERVYAVAPATPALRPSDVISPVADYEVWENTVGEEKRLYRVETGIKFDDTRWRRIHHAPCEPKYWAHPRILK